MTDTDETAGDATPKKSKTRWIKWVVLGGIGAVVLLFAGIFVYANFINDSPDALDETDLSNALTATTEPQVTEPTSSTEPTATTEVPNTDAPTSGAGFDGDWVPTTASEFGYRVDEVIAGVNVTTVGRSNEIDGLLTIDGTTATAVDIGVMIENITSDDSQRDAQFRGRIMSADEFPTATFSLTEPIEFGEIPTDRSQVVATANGELTLRGVTNPVTFDVTAETNRDRIGVLGSIPVLFEDYGIDNPSFGVVSTEDDGLVEFVLVFERP